MSKSQSCSTKERESRWALSNLYLWRDSPLISSPSLLTSKIYSASWSMASRKMSSPAFANSMDSTITSVWGGYRGDFRTNEMSGQSLVPTFLRLSRTKWYILVYIVQGLWVQLINNKAGSAFPQPRHFRCSEWLITILSSVFYKWGRTIPLDKQFGNDSLRYNRVGFVHHLRASEGESATLCGHSLRNVHRFRWWGTTQAWPFSTLQKTNGRKTGEDDPGIDKGNRR